MISVEKNRTRPEPDFLVAVLTLPVVFDGEMDLLEGLLAAGLPKLHIRKPGVGPDELGALLDRLSPKWASRLVLHGSRELAGRYGIPQVHGAVNYRDGSGRSGGGPFVGVVATDAPREAVASGGDFAPGEAFAPREAAGNLNGIAVSTSVHSWTELAALPEGLAYALISPLFDSISKPGYGANQDLLRQPETGLPCLPVGLGGVGADTIGALIRHGWKGAAVLGWIWEEPREAVRRYEQLKKIIETPISNE